SAPVAGLDGGGLVVVAEGGPLDATGAAPGVVTSTDAAPAPPDAGIGTGTMDASLADAATQGVGFGLDAGMIVAPAEGGTPPGNLQPNPFGCKFGWGRDSTGSPTSYGYLQFLSTWIGSEVKADGTITTCNACSWLSRLAGTNLVPVFYAYFIGFLGHANGLADGNQTPNTANLTTGGGALVKANRSKIVQMYGWYAQQMANALPNRPSIWLLEGDYVQYAATSQSSPLTYPELGQLAADITTAIKSQMPKAVVAIDHSTWNSDDVTRRFWGAMALANYDLVWTTGVGNNNGFLDGKETSATYNATTATYAYLHTLTGRKILVDESAGLSQASDTWSNQPAAIVNARIADGVIAANVTGAPANYQADVAALQPQLASTCP
ncbi:MAG: hypothetical protein M3O50_11035, partial [Myxococcota bacterium]|nr:hypothetical protein [Myxococcota bacterium]